MEQSFHSNGQLRSEVNYKGSEMHGFVRWWHNNGQLSSEYNYKDDHLHGLYKSWDSKGRLNYESYYWEGRRIDSKEAYEEQLVANKDW